MTGRIEALQGAPHRGAERFAARLARHWRALATLAWPVVLSRAGVMVMAMADVMMVGRFGTQPLAELALGYAVFIPIFVAGIGCLVGVISITARGLGAGSSDLPAAALRGLHWSVLVGGVAAALCLGPGRSCA